jgi:hypothetical protein
VSVVHESGGVDVLDRLVGSSVGPWGLKLS